MTTTRNGVVIAAICLAFLGVKLGEAITDACFADDECTGQDQYCLIDCPADQYPSHTAMLTSPVELLGSTFVEIPSNRYPDFAGDLTFFARLSQMAGTRGYLVYYGRSMTSPNFAIELDSTTSGLTSMIFRYTNSNGVGRSHILMIADLADGTGHCLAIAFDPSEGLIIYIDGNLRLPPNQRLDDPDFTFGVTTNDPPHLLVGGSPDSTMFLKGTVDQIVIFNSLLGSNLLAPNPGQDQDFSHGDDEIGVCLIVALPRGGTCSSYLQLDDSCTPPATQGSLLCSGDGLRCEPTLRCLPDLGNRHTCQYVPPVCSSDSDCPEEDFFCGMEFPSYGSEFYKSEELNILGDKTDYITTTTAFDGLEFITRPAADHPDLNMDLTIYAVVQQDIGNDGFVIAKGANRAMRDWGLYLRGSVNEIQLFYRGIDGETQQIVYTGAVIDDGQRHVVAAVIDSANSRAILYIDGLAANATKLTTQPKFRPGFNSLYIGGTPEATETRYDRFKGSIDQLSVYNSVVTYSDIAKLNDSVIDPTTTRYCRKYVNVDDNCFLGDDNDYRCMPPARCTPYVKQSVAVNLPDVGEAFSASSIVGRCVTPCVCNDDTPDSQVCGSDGQTYASSCYAQCAGVEVVSSNGPCTLTYEQLYNMRNAK